MSQQAVSIAAQPRFDSRDQARRRLAAGRAKKIDGNYFIEATSKPGDLDL